MFNLGHEIHLMIGVNSVITVPFFKNKKSLKIIRISCFMFVYNNEALMITKCIYSLIGFGRSQH